MSRNRKPLEMQKGNLTVEQQEKKEQEENLVTVGNEQLRSPPTWLIDKVAKDEFKRIVKEFEGINVVGNLDLNNISAYCNAFSMYRKTTKQLKSEDILIEKKTQFGTIYVENPLINIQKKYAEEMRKFANTCGLTIDSRLKVASKQVDKTQKDIEDKFGDI